MPLISQSAWQIGSPFSAYFMTSQPLPQFSLVSAGQLQVQRFASCCFPPRAGAPRLLDVSPECLWKLLGSQFDVIIKTCQPWKHCPSGLSSGAPRQQHQGLGKRELEGATSQSGGLLLPTKHSLASNPLSSCHSLPRARITGTTMHGFRMSFKSFTHHVQLKRMWACFEEWSWGLGLEKT